MRNRMNVRLSPAILAQVAELADRRKVSQSAIIEAAIMSFLSPDGAERSEAALSRRLDRMTRQLQRLERNTRVATETLAMFVRLFLNHTPPLPPEERTSAQAQMQKRYEGFVEALGRRLQKGQSFLSEIPEDIDGIPLPSRAPAASK